MFKKRLPKPEHGFTLVEVLVAILIATIFVTVTMQMMVMATIFKVRAQEYAEATNWIQQDLENVKFQASQIGIKEVQSMTASNDLITIPNHGFTNGDPVVFQGDGTIAGGLSKSTTYYVIDTATNTFKVASTAGGTAIDLTSDSDSSTGSLISIATAKCAAISADTGYADSLRDLINDPSNASANRTSVPISKTSSFTTKQFTLTRNTTIPSSTNDKPYNVLQISYDVSPTSGGTSVASFYTEVIPNAAFQCPN
jgi:prepilin-type N-terminal cleavage/methylation domain-containing protein